MIRLLALLLCALSLWAQAPVPAAAQAGPNFNAQAATDGWLAMFPPDKKAKSDAYFEGGYWLILWDFLYSAAISITLLTTGIANRLRDIAEKVTRRKPLITFFYWAEYLLITSILSLPMTLYEGFFRERQYNLMNQTLGAWTIDQLKGFGVAAVLGGLVIMALFGVVRKLPATWHIWGAVVAIVFSMTGNAVFPVFLAPMFNKYTILTDAKVRDPILRLARENGIPATDVYEVDASRQSNRVSANVSGVFGTERITLNDNLLKRCSLNCVQAVMGHEMGHYVMNHIYKAMAFTVIMFVVFFAVLRWGVTKGVGHWGIRDAGDPAILPLAVLILSILGFLYTPFGNTLTRTQEYEADIFGLNTARQPDGFAEASIILGEYRKLDPRPIEEFIFFDHPGGRTRIYSAMRWKAENLK
jgi:STE24 endopeptidase